MPAEMTVEPLVLDLTESVPEHVRQGPGTLIVPSTDPLFESIAEVEAQVFPEAPRLFDDGGNESLFHFMLIVVEGSARHIVRLSGPGPLGGRPGTLPFFVPDLIGSGGQVDQEELNTYYALMDVKLERMMSVETNFRLGDHLEPLRSADLAYLSLFGLNELTGSDGVLAHLNAPAIASLERVGVQWHHLAGRTDLRTPTVGPGGAIEFDPDYFPVCILTADPGNQRVFGELAPVTPPLYFLGREELVVDVRSTAEVTPAEVSEQAG